MERVDLPEKFALISDCWRPRIAAELNGQELKLVKMDGAFPWHRHEATDEMFFVWKGSMRLEFRDRVLELGPGQFAVAPRGVEHRPVSETGAEVLLFEQAGESNTGDVVDAVYTAPSQPHI